MTRIELPFPVSVNDMFLNNRGRGKGRIKSPGYRAWIESAGYKLLAQRVPKFNERVSLSIELDETRRGDCSNRIKCVEDLLVSHGVIPDDSKKWVKGVSVSWAPVKDCVVHIKLAEAA